MRTRWRSSAAAATSSGASEGSLSDGKGASTSSFCFPKIGCKSNNVVKSSYHYSDSLGESDSIGNSFQDEDDHIHRMNSGNGDSFNNNHQSKSNIGLMKDAFCSEIAIHQLKGQVFELFNNDTQALDSAIIVGNFLISVSQRFMNQELKKSDVVSKKLSAIALHIDSIMTFADALRHAKEYHRAIKFYQQVLDLCSHHAVVLSTYSTTSARDDDNLTLSPSNSIYLGKRFSKQSIESTAKYSIAVCYTFLTDDKSAIKVLESMSTNLQTWKSNLLLAKLLRKLNCNERVINLLRNVLKENPLAIEAATILLDMEVNVNDVCEVVGSKYQQQQQQQHIQHKQPADPRFPHLSKEGGSFSSPIVTKGSPSGKFCLVSPDASKTNSKSLLPSTANPQFLIDYCQGYGLAAQYRFRDALQVFLKINKDYPNVFHVLIHIARLYHKLQDRESAMLYFTRARTLDPCAMDSMDIYASLIRGNRDSSALNRMANEVLQVAQHRPESWVIAALFCEMNHDLEKALKLTEKALQIDPMHLSAYHFKGALQNALKNVDESLKTYYKAYKIQKDFNAYKGLVSAYLEKSNIEQALHYSKEALERMKEDSRVLIMVGKVLLKANETKGDEKAIRAFIQSLKLDPTNAEASLLAAHSVLQTVSVVENDRISLTNQSKRKIQDQLSEVLQLFQVAMHYQNKETMHITMAHLYLTSGHLSDSMIHVNHALAIDPNNREANELLDKLGSMIKDSDQNVQASSNRIVTERSYVEKTAYRTQQNHHHHNHQQQVNHHRASTHSEYQVQTRIRRSIPTPMNMDFNGLDDSVESQQQQHQHLDGLDDDTDDYHRDNNNNSMEEDVEYYQTRSVYEVDASNERHVPVTTPPPSARRSNLAMPSLIGRGGTTQGHGLPPIATTGARRVSITTPSQRYSHQ